MLRLAKLVKRYQETYRTRNYSVSETYFAGAGYEDGFTDAVEMLKEKGLLKDGVDIDLDNL